MTPRNSSKSRDSFGASRPVLSTISVRFQTTRSNTGKIVLNWSSKRVGISPQFLHDQRSTAIAPLLLDQLALNAGSQGRDDQSYLRKESVEITVYWHHHRPSHPVASVH